MEASKSVLVCYQRILELSDRMLALAKKAEWAELIEVEQRYLEEVGILPGLIKHDNIVSNAEQGQIKRCLDTILSNETAITQLLESRLKELKGLIGQSARQQSVNAAYHKFADHDSMLPGGGKE
ncbi:flagellar protein FliT [Lonsdalea quercina]|uniref:Flagellar protein FliT n=1 Tax=Lonsdalea quercina TaxID=71657 RepID=A0A1H3VI71_9GAMM|nr:flagellar protein FliT [Lonsdalea quercina]SDZ74371.1 flagellar protein FliT [Lonsdalea quercina]